MVLFRENLVEVCQKEKIEHKTSLHSSPYLVYDTLFHSPIIIIFTLRHHERISVPIDKHHGFHVSHYDDGPDKKNSFILS